MTCYLYSAILALTIPSGGKNAELDPASRDTLVAASKGWEALRIAYSRCAGKLEVRNFEAAAAKDHLNARCEMDFDVFGEYVAVELRIPTMQPYTLIGGRESWFMVKKSLKDATFSFVGTITKGKSKDAKAESAFKSKFAEHARSPFSLYATPLNDLLRDPKFRIVKIETTDGGNKRFTFIDESKLGANDAFRFFSEGWFVADPKQSWAVINAYLVNPAYPTGASKPRRISRSTKAVFEGRLGSSPMIKRHAILDDDGKDVVVAEFSELRVSDSKEEDFSMPKYGLKDPGPARPPKGRQWLALPAGLAAVALLAYAVSRRFRRADK